MCLNAVAQQSGFRGQDGLDAAAWKSVFEGQDVFECSSTAVRVWGPGCVWMQQHGSQCLGVRMCLNAAAPQSGFGGQNVFGCSSTAVTVWGPGCDLHYGDILKQSFVKKDRL